MDNFEYIFYIDLDAIIMNMDMKLQDFIEHAPGGEIILTEDAHGINTGLMFMHKSEWTKSFLNLAFSQKHLALNEETEDGIPYPFEYEQRAFHYLYGTSFWLDRGLPKYRESPDVQSHIAVMPQCAFNSYSLHPISLRSSEDWTSAAYANGDFAVHFAGVKGYKKLALMEAYLESSEEINQKTMDKYNNFISEEKL